MHHRDRDHVGRRRNGMCSRLCFVSLLVFPIVGFILVPVYMHLTYGKMNTVMKTKDKTRPMYLIPANLTRPSNRFLEKQNPVVRSEFAGMYSFPQEFLANLRKQVDQAPINNISGNRQVMFTMFNIKHLDLAMNLYCSSVSAGVPANFHIFITLDKDAFEAMKSFVTDREVVFMDVADRKYEYEQFCKVKLFMQYQLLLWGVEATICDDDLVIIKNPMNIFETNTSHFEVSTESIRYEFDPTYDFDEFNVGFMRAIPSETTIRLYKKWLAAAVPNSSEIDQKVLHAILRPVRRHIGVNQYQYYNLASITGVRETLVIRFYDPLDVVNGGVFHWNKNDARAAARRRKIAEPYVVHLAWITQLQKRPVLTRHRLWFYNMKCGERPAGAAFEEWH